MELVVKYRNARVYRRHDHKITFHITPYATDVHVSNIEYTSMSVNLIQYGYHEKALSGHDWPPEYGAYYIWNW